MLVILYLIYVVCVLVPHVGHTVLYLLTHCSHVVHLLTCFYWASRPFILYVQTVVHPRSQWLVTLCTATLTSSTHNLCTWEILIMYEKCSSVQQTEHGRPCRIRQYVSNHVYYISWYWSRPATWSQKPRSNGNLTILGQLLIHVFLHFHFCSCILLFDADLFVYMHTRYNTTLPHLWTHWYLHEVLC